MKTIWRFTKEIFPYCIIGMLLGLTLQYKQKYEFVQKQYDTLQIIKYNKDGSKEYIKQAKPKLEERIKEL